jgi:hypothetical protein
VKFRRIWSTAALLAASAVIGSFAVAHRGDSGFGSGDLQFMYLVAFISGIMGAFSYAGDRVVALLSCIWSAALAFLLLTVATTHPPNIIAFGVPLVLCIACCVTCRYQWLIFRRQVDT